MDKNSLIYVAGHRGLVGSAIVRRLNQEGYDNLLLKTHHECNLTDALAVEQLFEDNRPEYVFLAAAKVGGILANDLYPADFLRENLLIQTHVMDAAREYNVKKLLFLGSSCIYPKLAPQPIREEYLLSGPLEPTNEAYALAKIAGIMLCKTYRKQYGLCSISLMPTNLYGPEDNFDLETSHVLPAMIRKFHDAKVKDERTVTLWGTGSPRREFLHVDDLADASLFLMNNYDAEEIINVGTGEDLTIRQLAEMIREVVEFEGAISWDSSRPDGTPRKLLDVSRLFGLGWKPTIALHQGIHDTYKWYSTQQEG